MSLRALTSCVFFIPLSFRPVVLFFVFGLSFIDLSAQNRLVSGNVADKETGLPLPMTNVFIKGTTIGTTSDDLGFFEFYVPKKCDTLYFSSIGYRMRCMTLSDVIKNVRIELEPDVISLAEVSVAPDDSWVRYLLNQMVEARDKNNPDNIERSSFEKYSLRRFNLNNVDSTLMQSKTFRNHQEVFKKKANGSHYLPVYMSEQIFHNENQRNPALQKSTIIADNTVGIGVLGDYDIDGYTNGLDNGFSFYDNTIRMFGENFISPTSSIGWSFYNYYLEDSVMVDDVKHYQVLFVPKRKRDKVFRGRMILEDKNFSLVKVDAVLSTSSNMTFLKQLELNVSYQPINDTVSFYDGVSVKAVFDYKLIDLPTNSPGFEVDYEKSFAYSKIRINETQEVLLSAKNISYETLTLKGAEKRDSTYWSENRKQTLGTKFKHNYAAIDSVNTIGTVKVLDNVAKMMFHGFYDVGVVEIGPVIDMVTFNKVEGMRLFMGARTSKEISTDWLLFGGVGYGTRTEQFSGTAGGGYKFKGDNRKVMMLKYSDTYGRIGENGKLLYLKENKISPNENNFVAAVFARDEFNELMQQKVLCLMYEHEWRKGLVTTSNVRFDKQYSPEFFPFTYKGNSVTDVTAVDLTIDQRWSWKEKVIDDDFMRLYSATKYPVVHGIVSFGRVEYAGVNSIYGKIGATIKHRFALGPTDVKYALESGVTFGKLPYTLLEIPRGNETYGLFNYDFNMINYLEFVHDKYAHLFLDYHLKGVFINRVPLFRSLGFKEVLSVKTMVGSLSSKQYKSIDLPVGIRSLDWQPYVELGAGFENIFKLLRLEAIWRVTPQSVVGAPNFGVRAKFHLDL